MGKFNQYKKYNYKIKIPGDFMVMFLGNNREVICYCLLSDFFKISILMGFPGCFTSKY